MKKRVLILHTGGTLGMIGGHPGPFTPGGDPLSALLAKIPELTDIAEVRFDLIASQDSCDVRAEQWVAWALRIRQAQADGIVLIHGTDTMAYTASVLSFLLEERHRPVVLTGSQRPLSAVRNDARQNLVDAVTLAVGPVQEVMVCFDSLGLRGNRTLKRSSSAMAAFESPDCQPLVQLGVDIQWNAHCLRSGGLTRRLELGDAVRLSWVLPDVAAPPVWTPEGPGVHVIATLGAGNVPLHTGWPELVAREAAAGVVHLAVSQCPHGGVQLGMYASSDVLSAAGVLSGGDLTYVAAIAKARVGLGQGFDPAQLRAYLLAEVAGERTLEAHRFTPER